MILSFIAALQIGATIPAIRIETTTTSEAIGPAAMPASTARTVMVVGGKNFRMEEVEHSGPQSPMRKAGSVMLMHGADRKMFNLDPAKKEYWEIDLAKMQSQLSAMLKSMPGLEMKFSDMKSDVKDLGDGESVLGHPTRHFQMTTSMTMNALMLTDTMSVSMESSSETWFAKDLPTEDYTMAADTSMLTQFRDLIPGINAGKFREQLAKLPKLVPLKSVNTTSSYFGPIDMTFKVTQLATKVEKTTVPASTFEIPADYKKVEMPKVVGASNQ
jgi:hypothetical protein